MVGLRTCSFAENAAALLEFLLVDFAGSEEAPAFGLGALNLPLGPFASLALHPATRDVAGNEEGDAGRCWRPTGERE